MLKLETTHAEINQQTDWAPAHCQVTDHLRLMAVIQSFECLYLYNYLLFHHKIRDIVPD